MKATILASCLLSFVGPIAVAENCPDFSGSYTGIATGYSGTVSDPHPASLVIQQIGCESVIVTYSNIYGILFGPGPLNYPIGRTETRNGGPNGTIGFGYANSYTVEGHFSGDGLDLTSAGYLPNGSDGDPSEFQTDHDVISKNTMGKLHVDLYLSGPTSASAFLAESFLEN